jgi:hypothetical protein
LHANQKQVEALTTEVVGLREQVTDLVAMVSSLVSQKSSEQRREPNTTSRSTRDDNESNKVQVFSNRKHKAQEDDDEEENEDKCLRQTNMEKSCIMRTNPHQTKSKPSGHSDVIENVLRETDGRR